MADALFARGQFDEHATVGERPEIEHAALPQAAKRERELSLTFSCETEEDRAALAELLGLAPGAASAKIWAAKWPPGENDGDQLGLLG